MLDVMAQGRVLLWPAGAVGARRARAAGDPAGVCGCDFQEHFGLGQSKVSYHLRVLREAGLVREEARGKCEPPCDRRRGRPRRALDAFGELMRV